MARITSKSGGTTQVPVALPREESAPERWLRTLRLSGFSFLMLALLVLAIIVLAPNLRILIEQRQQIAALQAQVDAAGKSVDELTSDVARWDDPAYIESQARERLFYVFPGDVSYLVVGQVGETTTEGGQPISADIQTTQVDWLRGILASVYTAGLTDAQPQDLTTTQ